MKRSMLTIISSLLIALLAVGFIAAGGYGLSIREDARRQVMLGDMRARALLAATGEGAVESFVAAAKKEAAAKVKEEGGDMAALREASTKAEEEVRANVSNSLIDYDAVDTLPVREAAASLRAAMADHAAQERADREKYIAEQGLVAGDTAPESAAAGVPQEGASTENAAAEGEPPQAADMAEGGDMGLEGLDSLPIVQETEPQVDLSGFSATPEMERLWAVVESEYLNLTAALKGVYPVLDDTALDKLKPALLALVYQTGDAFETEFTRLSAGGGQSALTGLDAVAMQIARLGRELIAVGVALVILSLMVLFYRRIVKALGLPRLIIGGFFVLLCLVSVINRLSISMLLSNTLVRMGMNSIMVLAMVPAIQSGIKLNLGLPIGIVGGLVGCLLCVELGLSGWLGFLFAVMVGFVISGGLGVLYGMLLNRIKGSEMAVTTYVGFSVISLMCIGWLVFPFKSLVLRWPLGNGLRQTASLEPAFQYILDRLFAFKIGGMTVPTGLLLFMLLCCLAVWLFMRSKTGVAMAAAGNNPRFAEATGINVDRMRIIGTTLSMMLGALGIIVYSQSFGFIQLYTHPRTLGLVAASAVLIGGASTSRSRISHVLIGTFLFQGVLTLGMPVANALVPGSTIAETLRILVSNGIILYALTKSGGDSRG